MIHLVKGKIMIDCTCYSRVEIIEPAGTVECPRCHDEIVYNTKMTKARFRQIKRKAREEHEGIIYKAGKPQKYFFTQEMDDKIRRLYDSKTETILALAAEFGFPDWTIRRRAAILGVARTKAHNWTSDEDNFLEQNIHLLSWARLSINLGHTITGVRMRAKRLEIKKTDKGFTLYKLCKALGIDHRKVKKWIASGWLDGKRRGTLRSGNGDYWYFEPSDIRDFIIRHPWEINVRMVEPITFIEILTGEEIDDSPEGLKMKGIIRKVS